MATKALTYIVPDYSPLHDRVLVSEIPVEEKTKGGIIIPDTAKEKPAKGIVVAVGAGLDRPLTIQPGDVVNYSKYAGTELTIEDTEYRIMRETDVFGAFPKQKAINITAGQGDDMATARDVVAPARPNLRGTVVEDDEVSPQQFTQNLQQKNKRK